MTIYTQYTKRFGILINSIKLQNNKIKSDGG